MIWRTVLFWLLMANMGGAVELSLPPSARLTAERDTAPDIYAAPVTVFKDNAIQTLRIEGDVRRSAWKIEIAGTTPLQIMRPIRSQLEAEGYTIILDCDAYSCGGFDFRFAIETLPAPNMYVDIRSYQFVTAIKGTTNAPENVVTVLTSTETSSAYVQIIQVDVPMSDRAPSATPQVEVTAEATDASGFAQVLLDRGHVVLSALEFDSGTSSLGDKTFAALENLASFLKARPEFQVVLVGHTDSVGLLEPNIALSRSRAESVRQRLVQQYGVPNDRLDAHGMGYLAPIATNLTAQGREANRRVEAVLLPRNN
ncbi:MAG: cell envelope biogenesis protein OmpA [Sulfitobacter sp.]|jgi:outer membrane protein OmpA-like peptidoglycan-associated protein|nr:cell envelope biogenesis protein OmpA [Roseobacter sp.]MBV49083.1 cell envelope biogenesis protein OmpA [Roseobacter sp.]PHR08684.1 MAG: cell envelope biogenesis protein OmpA [Sulfitobacter sp.]|tara:strand:- start:40249 stop:41184 length:936 start_codon:yes stop_codon:yes gene_type:complete